MSLHLEGGGWRRLWNHDSPRAAGKGYCATFREGRADAQEKQQGQGKALKGSHDLDVLRVAVPAPSVSFSELIKGSVTSPGGGASLQHLTVTITYASLY